MSDTNELAAMDVLVFVREMIHKYVNLKELILQRLLEIFPAIKSIKIMRGTLWVLGEYCESAEDIQSLITLIRQSLGDLPIVDDELKRAAGIENKEDEQILRSNNSNAPQQLVTADGTYATQSAFLINSQANTNSNKDVDKRPTFRSFLFQGHFFIAASLARTLTKLTLKYIELVEGNLVKQNRFVGETILILASILHFGKSGLAKKSINEDDYDSINVCLKIICDRAPFVLDLFNEKSKQALSTLLEAKLFEEGSKDGKGKYAKASKSFTPSTYKVQAKIQPDDPLRFGQLVSANDLNEKEDVFDLTLKQAIGVLKKKDEDFLTSSKLNKVTQLTGFSDPVYAEAYVNVNQYDIVLDVLVVNQTSDTLQNLTLELATLGDLKLVDLSGRLITS